MPLDFTAEDLIPDHLRFDVEFEPTKFQGKKYVINGETKDYLGVVGDSFRCASHADFFMGVHDTMTEQLGADSCDNMNIKWRTARNNAWAMMDMTLPEITAPVVSDAHRTTIAPRIIALHGIDGSCSNMVFFGAIDFFCTNGLILGDWDKVRRKNTSGFDMSLFIKELNESVTMFYTSADKFQHWAEIGLGGVNVRDLLKSIIKTDSKADKMFNLYNKEAYQRGKNVWALYSAFTNYSSHNNDNGFALRNTGNDTAAQTMWLREQEVSKWISTPEFRSLVAA